MNNMVQLKYTKKNGSEVPVEEFLNWSARKQARNIIEYPPNKGNKGKVAWNRGLAWSDQVKKNISDSRIGNPILKARGKRAPMSEEQKQLRRGSRPQCAGLRQVQSPQGTFPSIRAWCKATGISGPTLRKLAKRYPDEYKLTVVFRPKLQCPSTTRGTPEHREIMSKAKTHDLMTPTGRFSSVKKAALWAQDNGLKNAGNHIRLWLQTHPEQFYYIPKAKK
jgi:hypothetical protein